MQSICSIGPRKAKIRMVQITSVPRQMEHATEQYLCHGPQQLGGIAQLARAIGSQSIGQGFESPYLQ